jgi:hypothetical protein
MKRIKWSKYILGAWILHFVIFNTYFGWNKEPINDAELYQDHISRFLLYAWLFTYISPIYGLYEDAINRLEKRNKLEKDINENLN